MEECIFKGWNLDCGQDIYIVLEKNYSHYLVITQPKVVIIQINLDDDT